MKEKNVIPEKRSRSSYKFFRVSAPANAIISTFLSLLSLVFILPMLLCVVVSFTSKESIEQFGYLFIPKGWSIYAYQVVISLGDQIWSSYLITIITTLVTTVLALLVMSMYAYVLAHDTFPLKRIYTFYIFFTMLFSGGMVASYIVNVRYLHLYDNFWILVLPSLVSAYNIIILRTFIQTTIPKELFEAARIDGAGDFYIYTRIVLPLFKAGLATIGLFTVVSKWNDWFTAMLYIENAKLIPLQTMLIRIQSTIQFLTDNATLASTPDGARLKATIPTDSARMAIMLLATFPLLCSYPFFQRYFVEGMTIGSVKG
ncbi:MAG: carbohydrate ABC transporter permease [Clostridiaceae bacterium]|nr:carbohydrate ABC transporter permease [Clostridiaceae bacterium]